MIKDEPSHLVKGLWCRADETFYYLETGSLTVSNPLDRLKKLLISRGLIEFRVGETRLNDEPYLVMTRAEAEKAHHEIKMIYVNAHVKATVLAQQNKSQLGGWR